VQTFRLICIVKFKKIQITYLRPATFCKLRAWLHDNVRDDVRGLLIFLYRIVDFMTSVTKQMEPAESNVYRGGLQNDNEELWVIHRALTVAFHMARDAGAAFITKNWVAAQLKWSAHFVQRNWRSPHDLQTEFCGSRPLVLSQEIRDIVGQSANRQRKRFRMLLLLLLAATRIANL